MDSKQARRIYESFFDKEIKGGDDEFLFIEACSYLIETENDNGVMVSLGGYYYGKEKYSLALKYYLMAFEAGNKWVADGLGFIYYYGRVGEPDYQKAFHYFSIARENGNKEAAMKIADMYRNGYGVKKDEAKYKELLLEIYEEIKNTNDLFEPYPEVAHRLADIYIKEGHGDDAIDMLIRGKSFITQRIKYSAFWGNFIVCRRLITLLYKVVDFNENHFDFFDLFYCLASARKVTLLYNGKRYKIESFMDEGSLRVKCDEKYYQSIENFLINALFDGKHAYTIDYEDFYELEIDDE